MSDKKTETGKRWLLRFTWTAGIARAHMSVTVDLPTAEQAGGPVAMIQSIADRFCIPLSHCSEASAERVEQDGSDDNPF